MQYKKITRLFYRLKNKRVLSATGMVVFFVLYAKIAV